MKHLTESIKREIKLELTNTLANTVVEIIKQSDSDVFLKYNEHEKTTDVGYALDGIDFLETILLEKINEL